MLVGCREVKNLRFLLKKKKKVIEKKSKHSDRRETVRFLCNAAHELLVLNHRMEMSDRKIYTIAKKKKKESNKSKQKLFNTFLYCGTFETGEITNRLEKKKNSKIRCSRGVRFGSCLFLSR